MSKIIILLSVCLTKYISYCPQEEKKEIRETLELYYTTVEIFKKSMQTKDQQTLERELKLLHAKATVLRKKALPISVSLEQRCNDLIAAIGELIKTQSTKQNTQL